MTDKKESKPKAAHDTTSARAQRLAAVEADNYARASVDHRAPSVEQKEG